MSFKCRIGLHSWGRWWNDAVSLREEEGARDVNVQRRECFHCGKLQIRRVYVGL